MASLTADTIKLLEPIIEMVVKQRNIYLSVFISFDGVNINVYPYEEKEGEE